MNGGPDVVFLKLLQVVLGVKQTNQVTGTKQGQILYGSNKVGQLTYSTMSIFHSELRHSGTD